jgi:tetratricopeptide (TPR) repeat protein
MRSSLFISLGLILLVLSLFWQVNRHDFVNYQDDLYVTGNHHLQTGLTSEGFRWAITTRYGGYWHPLTWLSLMVDRTLFGDHPAGYHRMNMALHLANTLLLFLLLRRMTEALWPSAVVAVLFAVHPLQVEPVAWVAARKELLATLFFLLSLFSYLAYLPRRRPIRYLLVILCIALVSMSNPFWATLPFAFFLLDFWPLNRFQSDSCRRLITEKLPLFIIPTFSVILASFALREGGAFRLMEGRPILSRIEGALIGLTGNLSRFLWPRKLAVFYPIPETGLLWPAIAAALLVLVLTVSLLRQAQRPYLLVGWFWYLLLLLPAVVLAQVGGEALSDRHSYLPLIGLLILITWGGFDLTARFPFRREALGLSIAAAVSVLAIVTWFQIGVWRNSLTLFQHAIKVTKSNYLAYNNFAFALDHLGKYDESKDLYTKALEIKPDFAVAHNNLGFSLEREGRLEEALHHYDEAVRIQPRYSMAHNNLAVALAKQGRLEESVIHFHHVLGSDPNYETALNNLGFVLIKQGKIEEAIEKYREALRSRPHFDLAHFNLGIAYYKLGRKEEADRELKIALKLNPRLATTLDRMGIALH